MTIEDIIFHFDNTYRGNPWYGKSILEILSGLQKESPQILGILLHMLAWRKYTIAKMDGAEIRIENDSESDWPSPSNHSYKNLLKEFETTQEKILDLLKSKDIVWLSTTVPGTKFTFEKLVRGIVDHDIYHIGQIALLQKLDSGS